MKKINLKPKIVMILLSLLITPTVLSSPTVSAYSANWGASSGGGFGGGVSGFKWYGNKQGARITVVDASTGAKAFGPSSTINVSSQNLSTSTRNYGLKTKLEYRSSPSMNKTAYFQVYKSSTLPKMVGSGAAPVGALKKFAMSEQFHRNVLIKYIPALKAMGEEAALAELATGKYKIILEPFAVTQINGVEHAITATEAALIDLQNGGSLDTHQPRGGLARWAVTLSHDWLPRSAYLEKEEFGIPTFANEVSLLGKYTVDGRLGKRPIPLNRTILDRMGIAVLSVTDIITVDPPKVNLMIHEFDGEYDVATKKVTLTASSRVDGGYPWKTTSDGGKNWKNSPLPGPTPHYFYLQWGSQWDAKSSSGISQDFARGAVDTFDNGRAYHVLDPVTGSKQVTMDLPEIPEGETFFVARYTVNPEFNAPRFSASLDPYNRAETTKQDNYEYLLFELPEDRTNFAMPDEPTFGGALPSDAYYNKGHLYVRPLAVMDVHPLVEEGKENSTISLTIKNETFPGASDFTGRFPEKEFEFQRPINFATDVPTGTGMTPQSGGATIRFPIEPKNVAQTIYVRMEVNPDNNPEELPADTARLDNIWEKRITIPSNDVDLIAVSLDDGGISANADWSLICSNILPRTQAENTKDNPTFLSQYPNSVVDVDVYVDGVRNAAESKKFTHNLKLEHVSHNFKLCLPNDQSKPGYNIRIEMEINKDRNRPLMEKDFGNNKLVHEFYLPTVPIPTPPPEKPIIPNPEIKLPPYSTENPTCYLPPHPSAGVGYDKPLVLHTIGTTRHVHTNIKWQHIGDGDIPDIEDVRRLNYGKPGGWNDTLEYAPGCIQYDDPWTLANQYIKDNQAATAFTWWNVEVFQNNASGQEQEEWQYGGTPKLKLKMETVAHGYDYTCTSNCCSTRASGSKSSAGVSERHDQVWEESSYISSVTGEEVDTSGWVCGDADHSPHTHYHLDPQVWRWDSVELTASIMVKPDNNPSKMTKDHATGKSVTKSGYGIYSRMNINYRTELEKVSTCPDCEGDAEAYLFMPHQNNNHLKRIVELDIKPKSGGKIYPTIAETPKNNQSIGGDRKQYIDIDYPDGQLPLNYRYWIKAPGFQPINYTDMPNAEKIARNTHIPHGGESVLGICMNGHITVKGNMWDDVWVHPDDPTGVR